MKYTSSRTTGSTGVNVKAAARRGVMTTCRDTRRVCPTESFTLRVTVNVAAVAYVWIGVAPVPVPPSPNVQPSVSGGGAAQGGGGELSVAPLEGVGGAHPKLS